MKMQIYQTIHKLSSDRTEFDESPKLQPLYIHNEFVKNIFNSVNTPKWQFWGMKGSVLDSFHTILHSKDRLMITRFLIIVIHMSRVFQNLKILGLYFNFITLHPYPTTEDYQLFFPKLLTIYGIWTYGV